MRGKMGRVLIALGAFMIVTAALSRFYAYDQLAVAPKNQDSVTTLVGPDATIFDRTTLDEVQTDLTTTALTVGSVEAADDEGGNVVVWDTSTSTRTSDDVQISASVERVAFDATTAEAVDCCGTYVSEEEGVETPVVREGLLVKFPFQTGKQTYDWWDSDLGESVPIEYVEEEEVEGLNTYKFEHTIEPTITSTSEVPASLMGLDQEGNVDGDFTYSNVRTLWVEPETGVIIKRAEQQFNTIQYQGEDQVTTTAVTTGYDDTTVTDNVETYGQLAMLLGLLRTTVPIVLLLLGLGLLGLGLVWVRREDSPEATPARESEPAHA